MKKLILIFLVLLTFKVKSQSDFIYKMKLDNVSDLVKAKQITDPLRDKFKTNISFNDSLDMFEVHTNLNFTKNEIESYLSSKGYTLIYFNKNSRMTITDINQPSEK